MFFPNLLKQQYLSPFGPTKSETHTQTVKSTNRLPYNRTMKTKLGTKLAQENEEERITQ